MVPAIIAFDSADLAQNLKCLSPKKSNCLGMALNPKEMILILNKNMI